MLGRNLGNLGPCVTFTVRMWRHLRVCQDDADEIKPKCSSKEGCKNYQEGLKLQ